MRGTAFNATARSTSIRRLAAFGTAALLTAVVLSGCSTTATPDATTGATTEPTAKSRPTPSAVATPDAVGVVIPGECESIYSPGMFEGLQEDIPPLNDPSMTEPNFSNNDEIEEMVRSLEFLECTWGGAGEVGIVTAVAKVSEEQATEARAVMESSGYDCYEQREGIRCVIREELEGNTLGESHFFRDDVWVSTFWLNAPIRGYTENIVDALWA
jgi:hypothetical protein